MVVRVSAGPLRRMRAYLDLFFMGAAFLLLETKNVVQFALLFGTTWFVNALVFAGVLLTVLAAIEVAQRVRFRRPRVLYVLLFVSLALAWLVPPMRCWRCSSGAAVPRGDRRWRSPRSSSPTWSSRSGSGTSALVDDAFGANLLGAMVGGVLEYAALVIGYRSLLVVVACCTGWPSWPRHAARRRPAPDGGVDRANPEVAAASLASTPPSGSEAHTHLVPIGRCRAQGHGPDGSSAHVAGDSTSGSHSSRRGPGACRRSPRMRWPSPG